MDELMMLRKLGEQLEHEPPATLVRQRERLLGATGPGRRWYRRPRTMVLAGGVSLAMTAGLFAIQTAHVGDLAPPQTSAADVLNRAAQAAERQQEYVPRGDQFVFVESRGFALLTSFSKGRVKNTFPATYRQAWWSVDGRRDGVFRTNEDGRWTETPVVTICPWASGDDSRRARPNPPANTMRKCRPEPRYRSDLPQDPAAMREYLYRKVVRDDPDPRDVQAFNTVGELVQESLMPAKAQAALFRATARLSGVTYQPDAVDAAGRHGVAVAQTHDGERRELIFDPQTYAFRGERTVLVRPQSARDPGIAPGTTTYSAAVLRTAIVDRLGQLP